MKLGSLFSGAGLGDLGWMMAGFDIRWQVEIDDYCRKVLDLRFPEAKKYDDIKKIKGEQLEKVDVFTAGIPCQPFSVAGQHKGKSDTRYLWPETFRVIKGQFPRWVVIENVSGIINMAIETIYYDLESEGYDVAVIVFPAHALGAWHKRERVWIIASMADTINAGLQNGRPESKSQIIYQENENLRSAVKEFCNPWRKFWEVESGVCRVADGGTDRMERFKALGNGQVVACTAFIGGLIMEFEKLNEHKLRPMP